MKTILLLLLLFPFVASAQFEGTWYSSFNVMGQSMEMKITVSTKPTLQTTLYDSKAPDYALECDSTKISDSTIYFDLKQFGLSFKGKLNSQKVIEGTMSQGGLNWEANFQRTKPDAVKVARPQEPKPPFDYKMEELTVENGDITLAGTLTLPSDFNAETPIVILASGTGPQDRDCSILGHKPFWVIADHLSERGIAVLRFDDRSTGSSTGNYNEATLLDFASDVETWARYLDARFTKNPLGLAGHSEGGLHTLIAATNFNQVDFIIQLAAISTSGRETLIQQQYDLRKAEGQSEEYAQWYKSIFVGICEILESDNSENYKDSLQKFVGKKYDDAPPEFDKSEISRMQFIMIMVNMFGNEWGRQFVKADASDYLKKLSIPLLAINGEKDLQVPAKLNSEGFKSYSKANVYILPDLNHLFQHSETGLVSEYAELEETFAPKVLEIMTDWILQQR